MSRSAVTLADCYYNCGFVKQCVSRIKHSHLMLFLELIKSINSITNQYDMYLYYVDVILYFTVPVCVTEAYSNFDHAPLK